MHRTSLSETPAVDLSYAFTTETENRHHHQEEVAVAAPQQHRSLDDLFAKLTMRLREDDFALWAKNDNLQLAPALAKSETEEQEKQAFATYPVFVRRLFYTNFFTAEDCALLLTSNHFLTLLFACVLQEPHCKPMSAHRATLCRHGAIFWTAVTAAEVTKQGYRALAHVSEKEAPMLTEEVYTFKHIKAKTPFVDADPPPLDCRELREGISIDTIDDYLIMHVLYEEAEDADADALCPDPCDCAHVAQECKNEKFWTLVDMRFQWRDLFDINA